MSSNGCPRPQRRTVEETIIPGVPKYLSAIDFGTTHCSVTYLLRPDLKPNPAEEDPICFKINDTENREPNCVLFGPSGTVSSFGKNAREMFSNWDSTSEHAYFEHVKKLLQHDETINRMTTVCSMDGRKFYLVDVIAHILSHLKHQLLKGVNSSGYNLEASDFDWVVTVPAIWKAKGKEMMREAGYKAGLCSDKDPKPLKVATIFTSHPSMVSEANPDKLSLALEPESAAIHCKRAAKSASVSKEFSDTAENYLIIDIGGGTVDIAAHTNVGGNIEELHPPTGNFSGGTLVNETFRKELGRLVGDPNLCKYSGSPHACKQETMNQNKADLNDLLYSEFETHKLLFGKSSDTDDCCNSYKVRLPYSFLETYEQCLTQDYNNSQGTPDIKIDPKRQHVRISAKKMEELFKPAMDGIISQTTEVLSKFQDIIDTIYVVGGFGGCDYVYKYIQEKVQEKYSQKCYSFLKPIQPDLAVIRGATAFRCNPGVVNQRKCDATYGFETNLTYIKGTHNPRYRWTPRDDELCKYIFAPFVERGDSVCTNEVFVRTSVPVYPNQTSMQFNVYSSLGRNVFYTKDFGVYKLGSLTIDMGGTGSGREVEVALDVTHTELKVYAYDKESGNKKKAVFDFLTCSDVVGNIMSY